MKKTLIIHPKDDSTSFLEVVYKNIENKTVVTGGISKQALKTMIEEHDRVMMMGHGSPHGLFSIGNFHNTQGGLIIDHTMVRYLEKKDDNVFIWCNADQFVNHFKLKGFYSGMFISEVIEANYCGVFGTNQELIDESNYSFVNIISNYINDNKQTIYDKVRNEYGLLAENNPVALYNNNRLYCN